MERQVKLSELVTLLEIQMRLLEDLRSDVIRLEDEVRYIQNNYKRETE